MNTANNTKIVCRCSECGEAIIGDFNIFSLSGTPLRIKCPRCAESELTVELDRVSKVRLSVPCAFCRGTHKYTLSAPSFFSRDVFLLQCALTGFDSCIMGTDEEKVKEAFDESERELRDALMQQGIDSSQNVTDPEELAKNFEAVIGAINNFITEGKYSCECHSRPKPSDIAMTVDGALIEIKCKKCGAMENIDLTNPDDVESFIGGEGLDMWL